MTTGSYHPLIVDVEMQAPFATTILYRLNVTASENNSTMSARESYWLELSLTPRPPNARARYNRHWTDEHFERMGPVFLVPPGETIQVRGDGQCLQSSILCLLSPQLFRQWTDTDLTWRQTCFKASLDIADADIRSTLQRLARELRQPGFASHALVESLLGQIAIEIVRFHSDVGVTTTRSGLAPWRLRRIDERLEDTRSVPTVAELAELCRMSPRHLTRSFRLSRGCAVAEYINSVRFEQAKKLLDTELSIKQISYEIGFASPSGFCWAFRRETGLSPMQYRQSLENVARKRTFRSA